MLVFSSDGMRSAEVVDASQENETPHRKQRPPTAPFSELSSDEDWVIEMQKKFLSIIIPRVTEHREASYCIFVYICSQQWILTGSRDLRNDVEKNSVRPLSASEPGVCTIVSSIDILFYNMLLYQCSRL